MTDCMMMVMMMFQAARERLLDDYKGGLNGDRVLPPERRAWHRCQNTPIQVQGPHWLADN